MRINSAFFALILTLSACNSQKEQQNTVSSAATQPYLLSFEWYRGDIDPFYGAWPPCVPGLPGFIAIGADVSGTNVAAVSNFATDTTKTGDKYLFNSVLAKPIYGFRSMNYSSFYIDQPGIQLYTDVFVESMRTYATMKYMTPYGTNGFTITADSPSRRLWAFNELTSDFADRYPIKIVASDKYVYVLYADRADTVLYQLNSFTGTLIHKEKLSSVSEIQDITIDPEGYLYRFSIDKASFAANIDLYAPDLKKMWSKTISTRDGIFTQAIAVAPIRSSENESYPIYLISESRSPKSQIDVSLIQIKQTKDRTHALDGCSKTFGTYSEDAASAIAAGWDGRVYIGGNTYGDIKNDIPIGFPTFPNVKRYGFGNYVAIFDESCNPISVTEFGSGTHGNINEIVATKSLVYIAGASNMPSHLSSKPYYREAFLSTIKPDGDLSW